MLEHGFYWTDYIHYYALKNLMCKHYYALKNLMCKQVQEGIHKYGNSTTLFDNNVLALKELAMRYWSN